MELIPKVTKAKTNWPRSMIIAGPPKIGKSKIASLFTTNFKKGESVILSVDEQDPYDQLEAAFIQFNKVSEFESYLDSLIEKNQRLPFAFIDNLSVIDAASENIATIEYMKSNMGKNFNRDTKGNIISPKSIEWKTVHDLPGTNFSPGYRFSREVMMRIKNKCHSCIDHVIFFVHIKDKDIQNSEGETIRIEKKLSLTGKLSTIFPAYVNAVCYMYADGNKRYLDFQASEKAALGATLPHLNGKILISEMDDNRKVTAYWDKIFPPQHTKK